MSTKVEAKDFERIFGGKPPAQLEFFLRGDELYHRDAGEWWLYDPPTPDSSRVTPEGK